jgi:alpha-glucosidase
MQPNEFRWWENATFYQVYVRSWRDSDGDGYGDLPGVIDGLDYLEWLGVDAIWLSPTMPSPDDDWGYDVADYTAVHPELGTLDDLDLLVAEARERGIRVLLDLVPNHTSSVHPWFVGALSGTDSPYRDFYVWADPGPGGGPPNNWLDSTGEPAWTLDPPSCQYYLHNFLPTQPDLNWWNPEVHRRFEDILRFWLDRGIAGFRIDVAHGLYKDAGLRDNPPLPAGDTRDGRFGLRPVYNANRPETHDVYRVWREIAASYEPPAVLLGETWVHRFDALAAFYGADDELQLTLNFPFVFAEFSAAALSGVVEQTLAALPARACPTWTGSNHDVCRFPARWGDGDPRRTRLALTILCTLPGTVLLYYGDEIGMTDVDVPPGLQRDPMTSGNKGGRPNRDRGRTPMQWSAAPGAGFTQAGTKPWLPFGDHAAVNVAGQREDPRSMLSLCRELLALRRSRGRRGPAGPDGLAGPEGPDGLTGPAGYRALEAGADLWVYQASGLLVAANFSGQPSAVDLGQPVTAILTSDPSGEVPGAGPGPVRLRPWEAVVTRPAADPPPTPRSGPGS